MNKESRNRGFSLIEIIVTIAIMAIVTGATMSIYSWIKFNRIKAMAGNVNDAISDTRSKTLSKAGNYELVIKKNASGDYQAVINSPTGSETTNLGKVGRIYGINKADNTVLDVGPDYEIHISFNKSDGSYSQIKCYKTDGSMQTDIKGKIHIEYAGLSKVIKLIELTGKHYID